MIVQTAPAGAPHFVMTMKAHCAFAGQAARAFGNAEFEPVAPRDETPREEPARARRERAVDLLHGVA